MLIRCNQFRARRHRIWGCLAVAMLVGANVPAAGQRTPPRESVAFVMGEDRDDENPYYRCAERYFREDGREGAEHVVTGCRSLLEAMQYLLDRRPAAPWDRIHLVSHGNPYQGLRARVLPGGKRMSEAALWEAMAAGLLPVLDGHVVDGHTVVVLHGCGTGSDTGLVTGLQAAFSGPAGTPRIVASAAFEYFTEDGGGTVRKFTAGQWTVAYRMGYPPPDRVLVRRLAWKYPQAGVDWRLGLSREAGDREGDVFHCTFNVPVKWVVPFTEADTLPLPVTQAVKTQWVRRRPAITAALSQLRLSPGDFNWWFRRVYVTGVDGRTTPALWIKGYCTVLCVLRLEGTTGDPCGPREPVGR